MLFKFLIGAVGTVAGAQLLVDNGSALASMCGVSDRVISVTIIAIGTSLPELVTTLTAIAKKQGLALRRQHHRREISSI